MKSAVLVVMTVSWLTNYGCALPDKRPTSAGFLTTQEQCEAARAKAHGNPTITIGCSPAVEPPPGWAIGGKHEH